MKKTIIMKTLKNRVSVVALSLLVFLNSCGSGDTVYQRITFSGEIFGTYYSVSYYSEDGVNYQEEIDSIFNDFNNSMSYYVKSSVLSRINRNETSVPDEYFIQVFNRSYEISEETNGAFDATVSPLVNLYGFGFQKKGEVTQRKIDSILQFVGYEKAVLVDGRIVKEDERVSFDFNAIAKGYAADVIGDFLESRGVNMFLVEIGGDMLIRGNKPDGSNWRIGIEKPAKTFDEPQEWKHIIEVEDRGVATSGNYRQYFVGEDGKKYSHTINPSTGKPVSHNLLSVTVVADDAMSADAYATAFMVMGLDKSKEFVESRDDLDAFFIFADYDEEYGTYATSGLEVIHRD